MFALADNFTATCPNAVENASNIDISWSDKEFDGDAEEDSEEDGQAPPTPAELTCAKWCPLENCTVLVLGELVCKPSVFLTLNNLHRRVLYRTAFFDLFKFNLKRCMIIYSLPSRRMSVRNQVV